MKCKTIERYDENNNPVYKNKTAHATLDIAIIEAKKMNIRETTIHKLIAYKCSECHKYHIGKSKKMITDKERNKWKLELKNKIL